MSPCKRTCRATAIGSTDSSTIAPSRRGEIAQATWLAAAPSMPNLPGEVHAAHGPQTTADGGAQPCGRGHRHVPADARAARRPRCLFRRTCRDEGGDRADPCQSRAGQATDRAVRFPLYARVARAEANVRREAGFVLAARLSGNGELRILLTQILPNIMPIMIVQMSLTMGYAILNAAGLSFIGLGVRPPTAEWGIMVAEGAAFMVSGEWWI